MRVMGLDLGSKTLGISMSDALGLIASSLTTIRFDDDDYASAIDQLDVLAKEHKINEFVLGLPKHMNGDVGIRGQISIDFKEDLEKLGYKVTLWDERLTTVAANKFLISADVSRKKRKKIIDQMAAVQILQNYLDANAYR